MIKTGLSIKNDIYTIRQMLVMGHHFNNYCKAKNNKALLVLISPLKINYATEFHNTMMESKTNKGNYLSPPWRFNDALLYFRCIRLVDAAYQTI